MSAVAQRPLALPRFSHGTLEAVKWVALALMTLDHVDAFVFHRQLLWAGQLGRLVFPVFAVVLAMNLAQPDAYGRGVYRRVLSRLAVAGAIAQPFHGALTSASAGLLPLNILATFAVFVGVIWLWETRRLELAAALFLAGGMVVEYGHPGIALCVAVWYVYRVRQPSVLSLGAVLAAWASLYVVNGSHAALWALPVLLLASQLRLTVPRVRWAFYAYYPAHLAGFWLLLAAGR